MKCPSAPEFPLEKSISRNNYGTIVYDIIFVIVHMHSTFVSATSADSILFYRNNHLGFVRVTLFYDTRAYSWWYHTYPMYMYDKTTPDPRHAIPERISRWTARTEHSQT